MKFRKLSIITVVMIANSFAVAQPEYEVLDEIIAVVGDEVILLSDLEIQKSQLVASGMGVAEDLDCQVMESLLYETLLLNQARVDSVEVSEDQIQGELDRRIAMFSEQLGGTDKLEAFYGKSVAEIRAEFHDALEEQLLVQNMQQTISSGMKVTPAEVEQFYNSIPTDSIPLIDSEVEVGQIMIKPEPSKEEVRRVKKKLEDYKKEVAAGKDFATIAILYSEDPGSATKGGELGLVGRGRMVPEFEQVAYNLEEGQVSNVFETDFGYHLMEMIERKGDLFNARHILLKPKLKNTDIQAAKNELDSIRTLIMKDSLSFEAAALKFSDDEGTKYNNGIIINPNTGSIRFPVSELDPQLFLTMDKLDVGEISDPVAMTSQRGDQAYRLVKLRFRSDPHKANLTEDYQLLQDLTQRSLTQESVDRWLRKTIKDTYIRVDGERSSCPFQNDWNKSE